MEFILLLFAIPIIGIAIAELRVEVSDKKTRENIEKILSNAEEKYNEN